MVPRQDCLCRPGRATWHCEASDSCCDYVLRSYFCPFDLCVKTLQENLRAGNPKMRRDCAMVRLAVSFERSEQFDEFRACRRWTALSDLRALLQRYHLCQRRSAAGRRCHAATTPLGRLTTRVS